jgi:hypothetical protein
MKVIDNKDLVREKDSRAVLNTNLKELDKYKQERDQRLKLREIADNYDNLKGDVEDIKNMLKEILLGQKK